MIDLSLFLSLWFCHNAGRCQTQLFSVSFCLVGFSRLPLLPSKLCGHRLSGHRFAHLFGPGWLRTCSGSSLLLLPTSALPFLCFP